MPFEDLTGGSGFTSDSEGASASLDISMSEDSARNLWDVQAAIQQIAVDFQTAVRAASDFQSYLISIRETGQTVKMPSLGMEGGEGGNMSYSGGRVDTQSVPVGASSEIGMAQRIGEMEENASGAGGGAMAAARGAQGLSADALVGQATNIAMLTSMTGQHGNAMAGQAYEAATQYAMRNPNDPQVRGAVFQGQRGTAHAYAATQLLSQGVANSQQFLRGGGVGGFASAFGRMGALGAIGYAGYQLANAGVETWAQSRSMGIATNNSENGWGWGFGQRIGQAGMAMTPFTSGEEAAQIYNTAVAQGWASSPGGFDGIGNFGQAVNFMYTGAKDYNMDPMMAGQLLETNAIGAGQSIQALGQQLLTLKQTLDGTGVSLDVVNSKFASGTGALISAGADPAVAAQIIGGALKGYSGNTFLGSMGRGGEIVAETLMSSQAQNVFAGLTGTLPGASLSGGHALTSAKELQRLTARFTEQVMSMSGTDMDEKAAMFVQLYNGTFGTNITQQDALNMIAENSANSNLLTQGQQDYLKEGTMRKETQSGFEAWRKGLDDTGGWASSQSGHARSTETLEKASSLINSYKIYSPEVNDLLYRSGDLSQVVLYGADGNPVMVDGKRVAGANIAKWFGEEGNYEKFSAANSGYYIQDETGAKYNSTNIGTGGSDQAAQAQGNEGNTVYITLSDQAKQWFNTNKDKIELSDGKN